MSITESLDIEAKNTLTKRLDHLISLMVVLFWVMILYYAITFGLPRRRLVIGFLGLASLLYIATQLKLSVAKGGSSRADFILLGLMSVVIIVATTYFFWDYYAFYNVRQGTALPLDYVLGIGMVAIITYLTYREFGIPFAAIVITAILYALYGNYVPGLLGHAGVSWQRVVHASVTDVEGIYGSISRIMAAWIALFFMFAGLLMGYGAFDIAMKGANKITGYFRTGLPQTVVVSSAIMGSINGSSTANAGITGSITIPLMKDFGLKGETAAGFEAVASNGGQIMPPIMSATAFVMASLLARPYADILVAGFIPALVYFSGVAIAIHVITIQEMDKKELEEKAEEMKNEVEEEVEVDYEGYEFYLDLIKFGLPIFALIYFLVVAQYTLISSALYANGLLLLLGLGIPAVYYRSRDAMVNAFRETADGLRRGALLSASIAVVIAALNVIVDLLMVTGVPSKLTLVLMDAAGGIMLVAILMAMAICIVLGMGMPTIAAYLIVALLVAPGIIDAFGVPDLAAHFFVFYAANLSTITPPIAAGVVVTTGIAASNFWKTSLVAVKVAAPAFVLPIAFIYNPEIVQATVTAEMIFSGALAVAGGAAIIFGTAYTFPRVTRFASYILRAFFLTGGILVMAYPGFPGRLTALAAVIIVWYIHRSHIPSRFQATKDKEVRAAD